MPTEIMRAWIPRRLELDFFDDSAWLGIVAGTVRNTRPAIPGTTHELTIRTYLRGGGVYLLGLDLDHALSLWTAQRMLRLRAHRSRMVQLREGRAFAFSSRRTEEGEGPDEITATWTPTKIAEPPQPGSFEQFFTARERLSSLEQDLAFHWTIAALAPARVGTFHSTILEALGFPTPKEPAIAHHVAQQIVELDVDRSKR